MLRLLPSVVVLACASVAVTAAAQTNVWTQRNLTPPPRVGAAFLDQPSRRRVLLYGGWAGDQGVRNDTWEWDGFGWLRRVPLNDPGRRFGPSAAFDDVGKRVLVYGGIRSFQPAILPADLDTWEWNGSDWSSIVTAHTPGKVAASASTWDAAGRRMLIFGGFVETDEPTRANASSGFWAFDGKDWSEVPRTEPWPTPRGFGTMAFDSRGKLVLHGGFDRIAFLNGNIDFEAGISYVNDTWEWDGASWRLLPGTLPGGALGGASGPSMAVEPDTKQLVLHVDGYLGSSSLYGLDATQNWVPLQTREADRSFALATWSSPNNAMLLSGGLLSKNGRPTAEPVRGEVRGSSTLPFAAFRAAARPGARQSAAATSFSTGQSIVFGGIPAEGGTPTNDTFVWTGGSWSAKLGGGAKPGARYASAMAPLGPTRAVLFGGRAGSTRLGDTWIWNGESETWTQDLRETHPGARELHAMVAAGSVVILQGGTTGSAAGAQSDTWTYTEADGWKQLTLPTSPGLRLAAFTSQGLDGTSGLLYGGAAPQESAADLWRFADGAWTKLADFGPLNRRRGGLVRDLRAGQLFLAGGSGSSGPGEVWNVTTAPGFELATLVVEDNEEPPLRRDSHVTLENPLTGGFLYYGGKSAQADEALDDTWQLTQLGAACSSGEQCGVGQFCTDGVCCETSSCGACRTCAGAGSPGLCSARGTFGPAPGCDAPGQACSVDGRCRLNDEETCTDDRACASDTCLVAGRDAGVCCQAAGCATRCVDGALRGPDGTTTTCGNYGCEGQSCKTTCAVVTDCAAGAVCDDRRQCVQPAAASAADDGCSCRMAGGGSAWPWSLLLAVSAVAGRRRRR